MSNHGYILNPRLERYYQEFGPFDHRFTNIDDVAESKSGDVFIVCPGPSIDSVDIEALKGRETIAVNRAGFLSDGLWLVSETRFQMWLCRHLSQANSRKIKVDRDMIISPRAAVWIIWQEAKLFKDRKCSASFLRSAYLSLILEQGLIDRKLFASGLIMALFSAQILGYSRVILVGADLSLKRNKLYSDKVPPRDKKEGGATRQQYEGQPSEVVHYAKILDGIEILNTSKMSKDRLPFKYLEYKDSLCLR